MVGTVESFVDEKLDGFWRSSALFDGEKVWFESEDTPLNISGEVIGCAALIPVLLQGLQLELKEPVCAVWKENVQQLTTMLGQAWGCTAVLPIKAETEERTAANGRLRGQFFSGGVDSFYELITAEKVPDALICLQGFDMGLGETARYERLKETVKEICSDKKLESVFLRTNIKQHTIIDGVSWDDAHGGVLAAIGHLLSNKFEAVVIPPSWAQSSWRSLWGSHWRIDPLWSSKVLQVEHGNATTTRSERIRRIAAEPLVQKHLRVCWSSRATSGNCSACAKCVRTMAVLHDCGELENFSVFDASVPIWDRIDQVPFVSETNTYDGLLEKGVEPKFEQAIRRLIKRSHGVALRAEYLMAHNSDLREANQDLEKQLQELQHTLLGMTNSRVWKAGKVFRRLRKSLKSE